MKFRFLSIFAAVALVAACSTASTGDTTGTGGGTPAGQGGHTMTSEAPAGMVDYAGGDRVHFEYDSSALDSSDLTTIGRWAVWLKMNPAVSVTVEGHCDERGTREYNLGLGSRRANSVKDALVTAGVGADRVSTISYGKERPAAAGHDEAAWAQNRRGVVTLAGGAS